jgi:NAD(P)-dependent dehydrogenase (short-subunit alcohol dehydrogenase family)
VTELRRGAVVTGAASGIGLAIAERLLADGWDVVGVDIQSLPDDLTKQYETTLRGVVCDVSDELQVDASFVIADAHLARLDAFVNAAGIANRPTPIDEVSNEMWDAVFQTNLKGAFYFLKRVVPRMKEHGGGITMVASTSALHPSMAGVVPYAASKGATTALVRAMVFELSKHGIRINSVSPGPTRTPILTRNGPEWLERKTRSIPLGRVGEPHEIAGVVAFTLSADASYLTGQDITVDGGMSAVVTPHGALDI